MSDHYQQAKRDRQAQRVLWFLDHLDTPPVALHRSDSLWVDRDDGIGSALGSPAFTRKFECWIEDPFGKVTVTETNLSGGQFKREIYRFPMRAALARLDHSALRPNLPRLGVTLRAVAMARGDLVAAGDFLARTCSLMGNPQIACSHFDRALHLLRRAWPHYDPS
jgi:hypothetical protein